MMPPAVLDHVSIAVSRARPAWPLLRAQLGGEWAISGDAPGFRFSTLRYANGMCLELLEPHRTDENPFVARFLDTGPGLHHLTFKVPDLLAAVEAATRAGYPCFGVRTVDPSWQEAFIHPKVAGGTLVQLAQAGPAPLPPPPDDLPPAGATTAALRAVAWQATDPARAVGLLRLLGGQVTGITGGAPTDVAFRGPGVRIRVCPPGAEPSPARLEFTGADPVTRVAYAGGAGIPFRDPYLGVDIVLT
ncbi:VOC family protein [Asanoa sp. WMMD1127]|uniref:VOC family protein n=1 Tax=Asanoa sp. WMMD1127 TaxID=3016107 RepID=UPI002416EDC9|nr:VOC family protein [Asanoa sp. WMMD1127]MDG4825286.1 VOC family protein [Asanoa sp. WMMD1127]